MAKLEVKPDKKLRHKRPSDWWLWALLLAVAAAAIWVNYDNGRTLTKVGNILPSLPVITHKAVAGKVESQEVIRNYSGDEVNALARQNYSNDYLPAKNPITKVLMKYTSIDTSGQQIEEYARVYVPRAANLTNIPVIVLAPGTTGIGDECAASLEDPAKANWANYESHAAAYAGQGYVVVIPDYEGMRDSSRIHHYMVGALEGRAVLDAARATYALADYRDKLDRGQLFLAGYSQGGHAAAFADALAASYAPDLHIAGLVAFAPVSDVAVTLSDVTRGSTLDWFGPFILVSYSDYYKQSFALGSILQPRWIPTLKSDVLAHCINSVKYWPTAPDQVYAPEFIDALKNNQLLSTNYPDLYSDIAQNQPWQTPTATPKLINQGDKDSVILPDQQDKVLAKICLGTGPAQIQHYADATHYTVMVKSFKDTLAWMTKVAANQPLPTACVKTQGVAQ